MSISLHLTQDLKAVSAWYLCTSASVARRIQRGQHAAGMIVSHSPRGMTHTFSG